MLQAEIFQSRPLHFCSRKREVPIEIFMSPLSSESHYGGRHSRSTESAHLYRLSPQEAQSGKVLYSSTSHLMTALQNGWNESYISCRNITYTHCEDLVKTVGNFSELYVTTHDKHSISLVNASPLSDCHCTEGCHERRHTGPLRSVWQAHL